MRAQNTMLFNNNDKCKVRLVYLRVADVSELGQPRCKIIKDPWRKKSESPELAIKIQQPSVAAI